MEITKENKELITTILETNAKIEDDRKQAKRDARNARSAEPRIKVLYPIKPDSIKIGLPRLFFDRFFPYVEEALYCDYKIPYEKRGRGVLLKLTDEFDWVPDYGGIREIVDNQVEVNSSRSEVSVQFFRSRAKCRILKYKKRIYMSLGNGDLEVLANFAYISHCIKDWNAFDNALINYIEKLLPFEAGSIELVGHEEVIDYCIATLTHSNTNLMNRHILLAGPPGCGKTMIAKTIAAKLPHYAQFALSDAKDWMAWMQIVSKIINACGRPTIIFIDEIDELGLNREVNRGHVYELLRLLDGIQDNHNVHIVATTNRPHDLDDALLRVGRLGPVIYIDKPDPALKRQILEYFVEKNDLTNVDTDLLLTETNGDVTGADIRAAIEDAIIAGGNVTENEIRENLQQIMMMRQKIIALREESRPKYPWDK